MIEILLKDFFDFKDKAFADMILRLKHTKGQEA
jgi:hypothetical protein